jgi:hypothetical protein
VGQAGWTQSAPTAGTGVVQCTNENNLGYAITLTAGQNETNNNFGNFQEVPGPPGRITIIKDTVPDSTTTFSFTASGGLTPSSFTLDDDGNNSNTHSNQQVFEDVATGSYVITETATSGYSLSAINCTGGQTTTELPNRLVSISVSSGDDVVCTFVNNAVVEVGGITTTRQSALAFTGSDVGRALWGATAALLVGALLVVVTRRRKRGSEV